MDIQHSEPVIVIEFDNSSPRREGGGGKYGLALAEPEIQTPDKGQG